MAYTRITNTRDGIGAIVYARGKDYSDRKRLNSENTRVLAESAVNSTPDGITRDMKHVWKAYDKYDGETVQAYRIIQSFGDEFNPENMDDVNNANAIGQELAETLYPDKQSLIVTQADGVGGKLHNHIIVNSVGFIDGKSLRGTRKEYSTIARESDAILERKGYSVIDTDKTRVMRTEYEDILTDQGKYVWKDDIRGRVNELLSDDSVTNRNTFIQRMKDDYDVEVTLKSSRKNVSYKFTDNDGKKRRVRDIRLGTDFGKESIDGGLNDNFVQQELKRKEREEEERLKQEKILQAQRELELKEAAERRERLYVQAAELSQRFLTTDKKHLSKDRSYLDKLISYNDEKRGTIHPKTQKPYVIAQIVQESSNIYQDDQQGVVYDVGLEL